MKKIILASIALTALIFSGCEDRLDIPQKGVILPEDYYKTDADAESALASAYYTAGRFYSNTMWTTAGWNECPFLSMWEYASDNIYAAGNNKADNLDCNAINSFRHETNNSLITGTYECYYMIIRIANLVIDNFDGDKADTDTKKRCVAEARVLRDQAQLLLTLGWGTAPIADHVYNSTDDKPGNATSQADALQWIADDLEKAIPFLTSKDSIDDKNGAVKVTKEYAKALEAKALLSKKDYEGAKTLLKEVIETDLYDLVPSNKMTSLYHYSGRGCKESVFELNLVFSGQGDYYGRCQPNWKILWSWRSEKINPPTGPGTEYVHNGWGEVCPSEKFVNKILEYDGANSARRKAWIKSYDEVLYEMPYVSDADCPTLDDKKADKKRGIIAADGLYGNVGYFMWKHLYRVEDQTSTNEIRWNMCLMRYAEVLLMYAECCAMTSDPDGSGLAALQKVNLRAQSQTPVTALNMATVKTEKFLEMWLDGTRFQDLVRWGDAEAELGHNGEDYPSFCDAMFTKNEAVHRGYIERADADWCKKLYNVGFKKGKNEVFPFPFKEVQINPNIKQNPGY